MDNKDNFILRCSSAVWMEPQISTEVGMNTRTGLEILTAISTWVAYYLKKIKTTFFTDHYHWYIHKFYNVVLVNDVKHFRKLLPLRTCEIGWLRASNWLGGSGWWKSICRLHELYNRWTFYILLVKRIRLPRKCRYVHKAWNIQVTCTCKFSYSVIT